MKVFWIIISNKQLKEALHCWIKVFIKGVYCDYLKMKGNINYQFYFNIHREEAKWKNIIVHSIKTNVFLEWK